MIANKIKLFAKLIIWFISLLVGWFSVTSFSMFILEEAIQSVGFGLFTIKAGDNMARIDVLIKANELHQKIMLKYEVLRQLNPISAWLAFDLYFDSVNLQMDAYNRIYK